MFSVRYDVQKDYWTKITTRRPVDHPAVKAFAEPKVGLIAASLPSTAGAKLLEVGAGNGYFSAVLSSVFDVSCVDFSENMLGMNPLPDDKKFLGDAHHLPFNDKSFDIVFCGNLLHHLESPIQAVREMHRVASRHVVLVEPNAANPLMFLFGLMVPEERGTLRFSAAFLKRLAEGSGLRLRRFTTCGIVLPNKTPVSLLSLLRKIDGAWPLGFYHVGIFDV